MKINEEAKKCVAFLQYKMANDSYRYAGTCFFVGIENQYKCVVTAKHVIEGIKNKYALEDVFIRVNLLNGHTQTIPTKVKSWQYHEDETVDIAIHQFDFENSYDHLHYPASSFLNDDFIEKYEIGCGDEVFITGLFKPHFGETKNSPIVRIGNIALMPSEKMQVNGCLRDAYLIESRSIGGLSGSPVFVNLGDARKFGGRIQHAQGKHIPLLLGLIHGHFNSEKNDIDSISNKTSDQEKINVGIAIVTPVAKLLEIINKNSRV